MRVCRNGRRGRLKISCWQQRVGSSPTTRTNTTHFLVCLLLYMHTFLKTHFWHTKFNWQCFKTAITRDILALIQNNSKSATPFLLYDDIPIRDIFDRSKNGYNTWCLNLMYPLIYRTNVLILTKYVLFHYHLVLFHTVLTHLQTHFFTHTYWHTLKFVVQC